MNALTQAERALLVEMVCALATHPDCLYCETDTLAIEIDANNLVHLLDIPTGDTLSLGCTTEQLLHRLTLTH